MDAGCFRPFHGRSDQLRCDRMIEVHTPAACLQISIHVRVQGSLEYLQVSRRPFPGNSLQDARTVSALLQRRRRRRKGHQPTCTARAVISARVRHTSKPPEATLSVVAQSSSRFWNSYNVSQPCQQSHASEAALTLSPALAASTSLPCWTSCGSHASNARSLASVSTAHSANSCLTIAK